MPSRTSGRLVELAAALLPAAHRARYVREFYAELYGMSRSQQLRHSVQLLTHAWALRTALVATSPKETVMVGPTRPLRCRLGLHRWDERENPETRERFQICVLCDAYHERSQAAPGAGAAGVTSGGGF